MLTLTKTEVTASCDHVGCEATYECACKAGEASFPLVTMRGEGWQVILPRREVYCPVHNVQISPN